jgi:hypothetical protein
MGGGKLKELEKQVKKMRRNELRRAARDSLRAFYLERAQRKEAKALKSERKAMKVRKARLETLELVFPAKKRHKKVWLLQSPKQVRVAEEEPVAPEAPLVPPMPEVEEPCAEEELPEERKPEPSLLARLPKDLLVLVLSLVPPESVRALACASKYFCELILRSERGERVWQEACRRLFPVAVGERAVSSWKYTYNVLRTWSWNTDLLPEDVELSNHNRTARCTQTARAGGKASVIAHAVVDPEYQYWSVRVDRMRSDGITVGVAAVREEISNTWFGYNSFATLWHQNVRVPYGRAFVAGDVVSVHLDFRKSRLAFYVNGQFLNVASRDRDLVQRKLHLAATLAYEDDQITMLAPQHLPPRQH